MRHDTIFDWNLEIRISRHGKCSNVIARSLPGIRIEPYRSEKQDFWVAS